MQRHSIPITISPPCKYFSVWYDRIWHLIAYFMQNFIADHEYFGAVCLFVYLVQFEGFPNMQILTIRFHHSSIQINCLFVAAYRIVAFLVSMYGMDGCCWSKYEFSNKSKIMTGKIKALNIFISMPVAIKIGHSF